MESSHEEQLWGAAVVSSIRDVQNASGCCASNHFAPDRHSSGSPHIGNVLGDATPRDRHTTGLSRLGSSHLVTMLASDHALRTPCFVPCLGCLGFGIVITTRLATTWIATPRITMPQIAAPWIAAPQISTPQIAHFGSLLLGSPHLWSLPPIATPLPEACGSEA